MSRDISRDAIRYEVYPELKHDNSSHIVSCSSNRNTVERLITAFAQGDPLSGSLYPLIHDANKSRNPSKLAQLSKVAKQYREHASALKREDARLQEDIMDIMTRLAQVRSEIVETENRLNLACNSMSPIRLLPLELLEVIFIEMAGVRNTDQWTSARSAPQTVISHVCGTWRRIALQLPHLWNHFLFDMGVPLHNNRHPLQQHLFYLDLWVKRSTPLPFSICLQTSSHFPHPSDVPYYHTILQSIADRASSRIELLRVHADSPSLLACPTWSQLTSVKRLELVAASRDILGRIVLPCNSFEQLPTLTSVYYDVSPASPFLFPVSFATLTEIEVGESNEGIDTYALRYLLRCCLKLKRGRFFMAAARGSGGFIMNGFISDAATRVINPNDACCLEELESLALNGEYFLLQTVFRKLETPKLESLELELRNTSVNDPIMESWKQTFESLRCLRTLSISCVSIQNIDEFKDCLAPLDQLQNLKYKAQRDSKFFQLLKIDEDATTTPLLPKLRRLSTSVWELKCHERGDFWEMFHSRTNHARQFGDTGDPFLVDAFVDSTWPTSTEIPGILMKEEPTITRHTIRFHIVSPHIRM